MSRSKERRIWSLCHDLLPGVFRRNLTLIRIWRPDPANSIAPQRPDFDRPRGLQQYIWKPGHSNKLLAPPLESLE